MKPALFIAFSLVVGGSVFATAATNTKLKSDDLSNMIIEGDNRLKVRAASHKTDWVPNLYRDVDAEFRGDQMASAFVAPGVTKPPLTFSSVLQSKKTASAAIADFFEPPILTMNVKPGDKTRKINWVFLVKNSKGEMVFETKKGGPIPETIYWEGFDKKGQPLQVGFDYTYSLSIIDEAGNPKRFSGDSFRVPAFRYAKNGSQIHLMDSDVLFDAKSNKFSKSGMRLLAEVKDDARGRYGKNITVVTYEDDAKFGQSRSEIIRRFLIEALDIPEEKITAQAGSNKDVQGYRHVEITIH